MDSHIFFRKIVIILVIRIEIFEGIPDSVHQKAEFLFLTGEIACGKMEGERLWNGFQKLCLDGEGGFFGVAALEGSTGNAETALQKGEIGKEWEKTGKLEQVRFIRPFLSTGFSGFALFCSFFAFGGSVIKQSDRKSVV